LLIAYTVVNLNVFVLPPSYDGVALMLITKSPV